MLMILPPLQESKRIELQLRGRAGRQGDPGETLVLVSLEDPLIQQYAKDMGPMLQSIAAAFQAQDLATLDSECPAAAAACLLWWCLPRAAWNWSWRTCCCVGVVASGPC